MHFLNVDVHFALSALLDLGLQLVDFRSLAADDDSGASRVNADHQLVGRSLDIDAVDLRGTQAFLELSTQLDIFVQKIGIVLFREPARSPTLVVAKPKPVRMCFLPQNLPPLLLFLLRLLRAFFDGLASLANGPSHAL